MDQNLLVNNPMNLMAWLLFVTGSVVYFSFVDPLITVCCRQHELPAILPVMNISTAEILLWRNKTPEERVSILFQVKEILEKEKSQCLVDKTKVERSLKVEREIHRKINLPLMEKLTMLQREIKRQRNQSQLLISQLKEEKSILEAKMMVNRRQLTNCLADTPYPGVDNYTRYTLARLGLQPLAGIEPLKPEYGPVINDVLSFGFPLTIPACRDLTSVKGPSVFIAVVSSPGNFEKRNQIRQTWRTHLNVDHYNSSMVVAGFAFILGMKDSNVTQQMIEEESQTHGDIIQIEMSDLSSKVAGLFYWLYGNCADVDFVLRVDDDVYVNVRNLAHLVETHHHQADIRSIFGNLLTEGNKRSSRLQLTSDEWPWTGYPPHLDGACLVLSGRTILPLLAAFQTTPAFNFIDDLYLSGICTEKAGIQVLFSVNSIRVYNSGMSEVPRSCDLCQLISWLTESATHMNDSHSATNDFYHNRTPCVVIASDGSNESIDHSEPAQFYFEPISNYSGL